jgi:hypothetical protein
MKTNIRKLWQFCCMVIVLGIQELLHGSWTPEINAPVQSRTNRDNKQQPWTI